jgi:hypothetical protein
VPISTRNRTRFGAVGRPRTSDATIAVQHIGGSPRNIGKRRDPVAIGWRMTGGSAAPTAGRPGLGRNRSKFSVAITRLYPLRHTARSFGRAHPSGGPKTYKCHATVMGQQYSNSADRSGCCRTVTARRNSAHSIGFRPLRGFVLHICINRLLRQVGTASETAERSFETARSATRPKLGLALN